nr:hypothetical protein HmN_000634500 [Hymenolepis microstoma]
MQYLDPSFVVTEYDWLSSCLAIHLILDFPIAATSSDLFPVGLIRLYRSGYLEKFYLAPLYDKLGVTFDAGNEYLIELPHCYGPSRVLRAIIYSLLVGVDEANGARFKLVGVKPCVKEICYEGLFRYRTYNVHVQPAYLPSNCSNEACIHTVIGFTGAPDISDIATGGSYILVPDAANFHDEIDLPRNEEEQTSKSVPSSREKSSELLIKPHPIAHPRGNLNTPRNLSGGGKGSKGCGGSKGSGGRPKKSGSCFDMLTKRFGEMKLVPFECSHAYSSYILLLYIFLLSHLCQLATFRYDGFYLFIRR